MSKIFVTCNECKKEFYSGYSIPEDALGPGNTSVCPNGHTVELKKGENVRFE